MKRINTFFLAAVVVCLFASQAHAQKVLWDAGGTYPKTGTVAGTILVKGTATAECGWTLDTTAIVTVWPKGSGVLGVKTITVTGGNWGEATFGGLTSKATYNVTVSVKESKGGVMFTIVSDPKTVVAK